MRPELFRIPFIHFPVPGYGAMIVIAFLGGTWWMTRRAAKVKCDPDAVLSLALLALVFGWLGGRLFYVIHYWRTQFSHQPWQVINLTAGGFEVYGGVLLAAAVCIVYLFIRRLPVRLYADLTAPTLMFGMGVGRIGCFLVGCCFGATCPAWLPWGVQFPALSNAQTEQWEDRTASLPAELIIVTPSGLGLPVPHEILKMSDADLVRMKAKLTGMDADIDRARHSGNALSLEKTLAQRDYLESFIEHMDRFNVRPADLRALAERPEFKSAPVHPAQVYSAIGPILLAWVLNAYFYRRTRHGTVMALAMILYGIERFIEEITRADNPIDTFGLTISQGVSVAVVAGGILWWMILQKMPLRSNRPGIAPKNHPPAPPGSLPA